MLYVSKTTLRLRQASLAALLPLLTLTTQAQTSLTNGLVAYWNFDQKNFKDSVGTFDGTENGLKPIAFVAGKTGFGQAIKLDGPSDIDPPGSDQFVEITGRDATYDPDQLAFAEGSISVAGWFTVDSFDKSWQALIAKGESSNWRVHRNGGNAFMTYAGGVGEGAADGPEVTDGQWHHFVAITDATTAKFGIGMYVDGVLTSVNENPAVLTANGKNVMIGENPDARNRYWNGKVDDLAIWNRVLTEAEVKALYASGEGKPVSAFFTVEPDTDKDGLPDSWETKYGLNPNDPTDAAKDCNNNGVTNLDEYKAGLDPCDIKPPAVVSTSGTATYDTVKLTFSEPLDPITATNVANYAITPSLAVTAVTYKGLVATLTTAKQTPASTYTVTLKGLKDISKNEIAAGTTATLKTYVMTKTGLLKFSFYGDLTDNNGPTSISGTDVASLYADSRYPATPDLVLPVYSFNSRDAFPDDTHDNYGATIEGFVTPKESGSYRFFVYSDDNSELYVSTDETPAKLALVAEEIACCNNFTEPAATHDEMLRTSDPITLTAGKAYFTRLVYKEGGGGDFGQVAWRKEGDTTAASKLKPIPSEFLSAATELPGPPAGSTGAGPTVTVARSGNSLTIQWSPTGGTLESSPTLGTAAVWTTVGTANPATVTIGPTSTYFRVKQ